MVIKEFFSRLFHTKEQKYNIRQGVLSFYNNRFGWLRNQGEIVRIIYLYRYFSLVITSLFYLLGQSKHSVGIKAFIVLSITVSSIILNSLYLKNLQARGKMVILIYIEIIGNSFLLIPSGGLSSPYIWYALNTVLITSLFCKRIYCWLNLMLYLLVTVASSFFITNHQSIRLPDLIQNHMSFILSFTLITLAIQFLSRYIKQLNQESENLRGLNESLSKANSKIKESINYILELYQAVHLLSTMDDRCELVKQVVNYTLKITKAETAVFITRFDGTNNLISNASEMENRLQKNEIDQLMGKINDSFAKGEVNTCTIGSKEYTLTPVQSSYKLYGVLGVGSRNIDDNSFTIGMKDQLVFLSALSAIMLKRFELEEVNGKLLITQEQNRIADEIHDSVLQRLFGVSCGIFKLVKSTKKLNLSQLNEELEVMQHSLNDAMEELRTTVYGISSKKKGINSFLQDISYFIQETKALNQINIDCKITGNDYRLTLIEKRAIYRIICESVGNAVRHGKASSIWLSLQMNKDESVLEITDNGVGFDMNEVLKLNKGGMGLQNILDLVHSLGGNIELSSKPNGGTKLHITIPGHFQQMGIEGEDAV